MKIKYLKALVRSNKCHLNLKLVMIYDFRLQFFGTTDYKVKKKYTSPQRFRLTRL